MLKTEKILLRSVNPNDVEYLFNEENNIDLWEVSQTMTPFSKHMLTQYANSNHNIQTQKQFRFIVEDVTTDSIIGMVDLFDFDSINDRVGVGIVITDIDYRKKGYAKEALKQIEIYCRDILKLKQIHCSIFKQNRDSQYLFESLGYSKIGERENWFKGSEGKWLTEILYQKMLY